MVKESKGSNTIRRRKHRPSSQELERARQGRPPSLLGTSSDEPDEQEDEGYMFDDEVLGPSPVKHIMSSEKSLFLGLLALRSMNALLIQTSFVPDEYWQSLEVAHNMAFGYGYMTWEWRHGLRGYLYPGMFAILYKTLAVLGLDNRLMLIKSPRLLQGALAACGDLFLYKLSRRLCDRPTAQWALLCQILSWFTLYCCTRTLTNSTESVLTVMALYYYPWPDKPRNSSWRFLALAALSVLIRPTAAILWILMCSWHLQQQKKNIRRLFKLYLLIGLTAVGVSSVIDRCFYGRWVNVQYNFLEFNVFSGLGTVYGWHPWHWYLSQGFPVMMTTHLLPFTLGAWRARNKVLLWLILWTVFIYSFLGHKEFRFIFSLLPLAMHYCGVYCQWLCIKPRLSKKKRRGTQSHVGPQNCANTRGDMTAQGGPQVSQTREDWGHSSQTREDWAHASQTREDWAHSSQTREDWTHSSQTREDWAHSCQTGLDTQSADSSCSTLMTPGTAETRDMPSDSGHVDVAAVRQGEKHRVGLGKAKLLTIFLALTNIPLALYFSLLHQRGTIEVMKYIHDQSYNTSMDVMFLMPCHSTPYYSYLHANLSMQFLTCEPNLKHRDNYTDEADLFYKNPIDWLNHKYDTDQAPLPTHFVYFNNLIGDIWGFLSRHKYIESAKFFHTHLPEGRVGSMVIVSARRKTERPER